MIYLGKLVYLFTQGVLLGCGPCLLACGPILLPYIAGTQAGWQAGLRTAGLFALGRWTAYTVLGGLVGMLGFFVFSTLFNRWSTRIVEIVLAGLLIYWGTQLISHPERAKTCHFSRQEQQNIFWLGVLIGLAPCLPLLGMLMEIMLLTNSFYQGFVYGATFGLGTCCSPLLLLGLFTPAAAKLILRQEKLIGRLSGLMLVSVGAYMIYNLMKAIWLG